MNNITAPTSKRLLVIDDEQDICELVTDVADMLGFSSQQCCVLTTLNDLCLTPMPDVLTLDLSMPNIDGIEIIHHLGSLEIKPQLILMSGFERSILDSAQKLAERLNVPVLGTLSKPFGIQMLKELLEKPLTPCSQTPESGVSSHQKVLSISEVETGIEQNQFVAYYQPQIDLKTGKLHGVEALVRWHHPDGLIMPDDFLPLIESRQLILPLTQSVIEQSLVQMILWQKLGLPSLQTSINLSAAYLDELNLPELMSTLLKRYPVDPSKITFEITERIGLNDKNQEILDTLTRLRLKGFYLSIDDFGTGYSSLAQLNQLPFNEIKIDKSFVLHLLSSPISKAIVVSSISLAGQLGVRCIAEGIETEEIELALKAMGCDIGQGYLYSKALSPECFIRWALEYASNNNIDEI